MSYAVLAASLLAAGPVPGREAQPREDGARWESLFSGAEGDIAKHWTWRAPKPRKVKKGKKPWTPGKWHVIADGSLECLPRCGYIWTKQKYGDFVLDLEFKVTPRCNSGLFLRSNPRNPVQAGMEIQILDSYGRKKPGTHDLAALYDCKAPSKNMAKKPGEWQRMILTANDNMIAVELNGERVLAVDLNQWTEARRNPDGTKNKFRTAYRDMPRIGHIGLQDHGRKLWFRNIRTKRLNRGGR